MIRDNGVTIQSQQFFLESIIYYKNYMFYVDFGTHWLCDHLITLLLYLLHIMCVTFILNVTRHETMHLLIWLENQ